MRVRRLLWISLVLSCVACAADPGELSPKQALSAFLTALDRSTHAPEQLKVAFEWVDEKSQAALKQRADLAASLAGRSISAWDMLVAGRGSFSAYPPSAVARVRSAGEQAFVSLQVDGRSQVEVPMRREGGRWRVVLGL
jgi:hypothetical protein